MNVQTRDEFVYAISKIEEASVVVADTETNTLKLRSADKMPLISVQCYLPEFDESFNFPFRHGYGDIFYYDGSLIDRKSVGYQYYPADEDGEERWLTDLPEVTGRDKRTAYWMRLYYFWLDNSDKNLGNLPIAWYDELKDVWTPEKTYIYHNANFDMTVLHREGFQETPNVKDTMIALQMVWGDWGGKRNNDDKGIRVKMPKRYFDRDLADNQGYEWGNRKLKWQARFWDLDNADAGENDLAEKALEFQREVVEYAVKHAENDPNLHDYLLPLGSYANWRRNASNTDSNGISWHDRQVEALLNKVSWNSKELKGRMWMLPSDYVATYGIMDVVLTSQLHDKCMHVIEGWGVEDVYEEVSAINIGLAWRMEQNGILIDVDEAQKRIDKNYAKAQKIMDKYDWNIDSWQEFKARVGNFLNLPDTQADTVKGALEWIDPDHEYEYNTNPENHGTLIGAEAIQIIKDRLKYKRIIKQTSTYLVRWVNATDNDNYCHAYIDVAGTKTGRTSSSGDLGNVQNIPSRSANIKEVIICPDNHLVFGVDYSNLELRIASWIAENIYGFGNKEMTDVINSRDAHAYTADVLGVREIMYGDKTDREIADEVNMAGREDMDEEILKKLVYKFFIRQIGKTSNFNLIYGGSHWSLGIQLGENFETTAEEREWARENLDLSEHMSKQKLYVFNNRMSMSEQMEALHWVVLDNRFAPYKELHAKWHNMYPAFIEASEFFQEEALEWRPTLTGKGSFQYSMNVIPYYRSEGRPVNDYRHGRPIKHHLYDTSRNVKNKYSGKWEKQNIKEYSAKKAWNNIVQGSASHINVHSGWRFYRNNPSQNVKLFAGIHDALDGYAHVDHLDEVINLMELMEDWAVEPKLDVELEAGLENWQHMREVKDLELWVDSKGREGYDD